VTVLQAVTGGVTQGAEVLRRGGLAVAEARRLAAVYPHSGPTALASLLYGMVPWLAAAGRLDVALELFTEATSIRRHAPGPHEPVGAAVPPPPGRPDEPYPTPVTAVAVPADAVARRRHRLPGDPTVAADLEAWLRRLEAEPRRHGSGADAPGRAARARGAELVLNRPDHL
jgi:hypothetical protein